MMHGMGALRIWLRSLARSPGFTVPSLVILALGMTAATAIFTVVDSIIFRPLPYPDSERLVMVCEEHARIAGYCIGSPGNAWDMAATSQTLTDLGIARGWQFTLHDDGETRGIRGGLATGGFFRALGVVPVAGRLLRDDEHGPGGDNVVLLSHAFWTRQYGADASVVGRTVQLEGEAHEIVGILPADFDLPLGLGGIEMWRPPHMDPLAPEWRGWRGWRLVGRMEPGATRESVQGELSGIYAALAQRHEEVNDEWRLSVHSFRDVVVGDTRPVLMAFLGAAGLLLLIVCANVANLLLARGMGRRRELAVRAAMGADRGRLVRGILGESLVLTGMATVLAVVLAFGATRLLLAFAPPGIPRLDEVAVDGRILAFAALISVLATALFAVLPALRVTAWDLAQTVKTGGSSAEGVGSSRLRGALVVAEIALSVVILASAALLTRSFAGYLSWEPGFEPERIMAVSAFADPSRYETREDLIPWYRNVEERLEAVPGVAAVSSASAGPLFGGGDGRIQYATGTDVSGELPSAAWYDVGPGYFATLGIPVVEGRELTETDELGGPAVAVVNEAMARLAWPGESAVGKTLRIPERELSLEVVGVVADVPPMTPGAAPVPQLYWPNRQLGRWGTFFIVRSTTAEAGGLARAVAAALKEADPDLTGGAPFTLASTVDRALVEPRFQAMVLLVFALAALVLAAVGVYAVISYAVARRIREMGIRMALGARSADVVRLVLRSSMGVTLLGVVLGLGGAWVTGGLVRGLIHGVSPTDPLSLGGAALVLVLAAALAAFLPARRATRVDPLDAIRTE